MTRVLLLLAGPTPWDLEDRLCGEHSLPLTSDAQERIKREIDKLELRVPAIYHNHGNEACASAAKMLGERFGVKPRHRADLASLDVGLWRGLTRKELRFRFPSTFPVWEADPASIKPPEGESLEEAVGRLRGALSAILRRNRGATSAIVARPPVLRILLGVLRKESIGQIAATLRSAPTIEIIEIPDAELAEFI
jgi:alpha-ribazole phosphatase/probable phosphoglycerate mutase